ncbi:MAG: hypothetical protein AVDCRST_MAG85-3696 [uncultured Solirubrobacteraceae bacterium]|uniref:Uncharacterized protein n=1 Tax=uncultured Solirubrobacteraceae bacterium TaxID=1162706 RepID=A0A6J4TTP2_9ACTN|nr:MAG: hypothetical protein AVDCRST_MAG85-3696 [uncultured Solirubrobacteraceae bacterium]
MGERREHPQRLLDRARYERRVVDQELPLVGVLHQRAHRARVRRLRAVVAGRHEQEEAHDDLVLLERLPVDLGVHEHGGQVVGRVLAPLGHERVAALEQDADVALDRGGDVLGLEVLVAGTEQLVHQPRPGDVVLGRDPHERPDDPRDDGLGDVLDEVAGVAALEPVEHAARDRADLVLVLGDPLRREPALEERLEAVVLRRVHPDEHRARQLDGEDRLADRGDAAELGRVGLPVLADRAHVGLRRDGPQALLGRELLDLLGPVHGALRAQLLEQLVGRAVLPELAVEDAEIVERDGFSGHGATIPDTVSTG